MLVCKYDLEFLSEILSERIRNRVLPPDPPLRGIRRQIINAKAGFSDKTRFRSAYDMNMNSAAGAVKIQGRRSYA